MRIFFDSEFTGLHKDTTLISIGLLAENGNMFYAEFTDYDKSQCDEWIKTNVLKILNGNDELADKLGALDTTIIMGTKAVIAEELSKWLLKYNEVQFISDVCHYDMVLDLFGTAFDLPNNVSVHATT